MKIYKFGGASIKDAIGVKNVVTVLKNQGYSNTLLVASAMGKMTNAFEEVINAYFNCKQDLNSKINYIKSYHQSIIEELFEENAINCLDELNNEINRLQDFLNKNKSSDYNFVYDQVVSLGEIISTKIVSIYLNYIGIENKWIDVRNYIRTDNTYRDAYVNWPETIDNILKLNTNNLYITQGFLGADKNGNTTTLGREGSDYTAAIFAHSLQAESVTIWKDVDGVLNADPRFFDNTQLLQLISYNEAIEMAFYGASVIHPKTLKPLQNKNIPLYVRSFLNLDKQGTVVGKGSHVVPETPCFILKQNQILLSISALDFSFMVEYNLSHIFKILAQYKLKVNLIQNSALSFSVCLEDKFGNFDIFLQDMKLNYQVTFHKNVSLFTIRHATENSIASIEKKGEVLLKQATQGTVQLVIN